MTGEHLTGFCVSFFSLSLSLQLCCVTHHLFTLGGSFSFKCKLQQ